MATRWSTKFPSGAIPACAINSGANPPRDPHVKNTGLVSTSGFPTQNGLGLERDGASEWAKPRGWRGHWPSHEHGFPTRSSHPVRDDGKETGKLVMGPASQGPFGSRISHRGGRRERELAVDRKVMSVLKEKSGESYGQTLLEVARNISAVHSTPLLDSMCSITWATS